MHMTSLRPSLLCDDNVDQHNLTICNVNVLMSKTKTNWNRSRHVLLTKLFERHQLFWHISVVFLDARFVVDRFEWVLNKLNETDDRESNARPQSRRSRGICPQNGSIQQDSNLASPSAYKCFQNFTEFERNMSECSFKSTTTGSVSKSKAKNPKIIVATSICRNDSKQEAESSGGLFILTKLGTI